MAEAAAKGDPSPPTKKMRTDDSSNAVDSTTDKSCEQVEATSGEDELFSSFEEFEIIRILNNSEEHKMLAVEGRLQGRPGTAVVVLQKLPFNADKIEEIFSRSTNLLEIFHNDIYYNKTALLPSELNDVRANIIYPAEEKHILRFERQSCSFVDETPQLYKEITKPFIDSSSFSKEWIYNILEHKKEADRIIFEDPDAETGFILVPDLKWTGEQLEDLYLQGIVCRRDITSLRDLRGCHIPLLKNMHDKGRAAIKEKYGVPAHKLRVYLHYQPSFYHLHVHYTAISFEAPGTWAGKAHLLSTVISNLEICGQYYEKAVLPFTVKDNHPLRSKFEEKEC
ncbi:m7GpppX diphosphatase isoform X2 [Cherax quadricarinatus]|uniref:m7GpppX diphosphatase isoform X2 n=1 Tax=Cherax quadricarinatus TaxID=27406 RepID=UPI00387EB8D2